jgi:hypothetical protein
MFSVDIGVDTKLHDISWHVDYPPSIVKIWKKRIRISIWHQKETYFKKQLGFKNVSSRAEVHSKICDQQIEA